LLYEAKCAWYFNLKTFNRTLRNILQIDEWADLIKNIEECQSRCHQVGQMLFSTNQAQIQSKHSQQLKEIKESLDELNRIETSARTITTWVSDVSVWGDHEHVRATKLTPEHWNSGQWLLQMPGFTRWAQASQGQLWLQGTMGTGKSCLTSIVINRLLEASANERLTFFYCFRQRQDTPITVLRSLVTQLSCAADGQILDKINTLYKENAQLHPRGELFTPARCIDLLVELIESHGPTTIVIDALDECRVGNPDEYTSGYCDLLEYMKKVHEQSETLKLFFSSRPEVPVSVAFPDARQIPVDSSDSSKDIKKFIISEINNPSRRRYSKFVDERLANRLKNTLVKHARGM
jgi:Cdc6-like AAA superfamily ATPase